MGCLPAHLQDKKHDDWLWPFKYIPRAWTSFCGAPPKKIWGNAPIDAFGTAKPVPEPGQWHLSWPFYVAFTTKSRWSFRLGARWDDVDHYYSFPAFRIWRLP